jgi:hypothetical protein
MKTVVVLASACLLLASPVVAQQTQPAPMPAPKADTSADTFLKIDANMDGSLSFEEIRTADSKVVQADFDKYDADKSKSLTRAEFTKWTADLKAAKAPASGG